MIEKRFFGTRGFVTDGLHAITLHDGYKEIDMLNEKILLEKSPKESIHMSIPKYLQGFLTFQYPLTSLGDYVFGYDIFKSLHKKTWGSTSIPLHTAMPKLSTYIESRLIPDCNPNSDPNKILLFQSSRKTPGYFLIYNLISLQVGTFSRVFQRE